MPRTGLIDHIGIGVPDLVAREPGTYSRHNTGLHHVAFFVASRAIVRESHTWARARNAEILDEPRDFPEYGQHYATYWLDPHGLKLEVVCPIPEERPKERPEEPS